MLLTVSTLWCFARNRQDIITIGHRGAMGYVLENTIPSIKKAIELGAEAVEIDVFRCASGEIVAFHDDNLKRLAGVDLGIESLTLGEIREIKPDSGYCIPTLDEVLKTISGRILLNIELKGRNTANGTNELVRKAVKSRIWKKEQFMISGFNYDELKQYRKLDRSINIAILTEDNPLKLIGSATAIKATAINPYYKELDQNTVDELHLAGFRVYPWTVNDPEDIQRMIDLGTDGIFCDYPDRVKAVINRQRIPQ